jgi:hypothetical protein
LGKLKGNIAELNLPALHSKQSAVFCSPAAEILYGGAVGSGKSFLIRYLAIVYAAIVPGIQIYIVRRLSSDIEKNHMKGPTSLPELLAPWTNAGIVSIKNSAPVEIRFQNGSRIFLDHMQHEKHTSSWQGREIHCIFLDESTHFTEYQIRYIMTRVRLGSFKIDYTALKKAFDDIYASWGISHRMSMREIEGYFPRIIMCTNPGGASHNFHKETYVDPAPPMQIFKSEFGGWAQYIPSLYTDNPSLLKDDPNYIKRIEGLGDPEEVAALKEGRWDILSGAALSGVWDPSVHIIEPFDIPDSWYIDISFDWGYSKPASMGIWAESNGDDALDKDGNVICFPRGTLFRIGESYFCSPTKRNTGLELSDFEMGEKMAEKIASLGINFRRFYPGPADNTIFASRNFRGSLSCPHEELLEGFNSYASKHKLHRKGSLFTESDKSPGSRIRGLSVIRNLLKASRRFPLEERGMFIFNTCRDFLRTVPIIPRDERNPEDVDTNTEDHIFDEVRYRALSQKSEVRKLSNYL